MKLLFNSNNHFSTYIFINKCIYSFFFLYLTQLVHHFPIIVMCILFFIFSYSAFTLAYLHRLISSKEHIYIYTSLRLELYHGTSSGCGLFF